MQWAPKAARSAGKELLLAKVGSKSKDRQNNNDWNQNNKGTQNNKYA